MLDRRANYEWKPRIAWLILAVTLPLFAVEFLRYNNDAMRIHIAVPMFVVGLIVGAGLLAHASTRLPGHRVVLMRGMARHLPVLALLFLVWFAFEAIRADNQALATREVVKIGLGMLSLWAVIALFPPERRFLERFWRLVIWASAALMAFLLYRSVLVLESDYLVSQLGEQTRAGRNQTMWYLVFVLPYAVAYLWYARNKVIAGLPLFVLIVAWIYAGSRGSWIAATVGILVMVFFVGRERQGFKRVTAFVIVVGAVGVLGWWALSTYIPSGYLESCDRFLYLFNPSDYPELTSYGNRWAFIKGGWDCFQTSPLIGLGLTNIQGCAGTVHNDYVRIFTDLGVIGGVLFVGILATIWVNVWPRAPRDRLEGMSWVSLGTRGSLVGVLVSLIFLNNAYTVTLFWLFLGLALISKQIEGHQREATPMPEPSGVARRVSGADQAI